MYVVCTHRDKLSSTLALKAYAANLEIVAKAKLSNPKAQFISLPNARTPADTILMSNRAVVAIIRLAGGSSSDRHEDQPGSCFFLT